MTYYASYVVNIASEVWEGLARMEELDVTFNLLS